MLHWNRGGFLPAMKKNKMNTENETIEIVSLDKVFLDRETQIRATVSEEMIQRYYEIMEDEEGLKKFPPIILYRDKKGNLWIADGHHRIMAAIRRKFQSIHAIIRQGEKADAIWAAVKVNGRNGLPLGRADIRRAVEMVIVAWPDKSDQVIADEVGCSRDTVRRARPAVPTCANAQVERRIGKDGKARPIKRVAQTPAASAKKTVDAHEKPASKSDGVEPQSGKSVAIADTTPSGHLSERQDVMPNGKNRELDASESLEIENALKDGSNDRDNKNDDTAESLRKHVFWGPKGEKITVYFQKNFKEFQTYSCGAHFEPDSDDDYYDWITDNEREILRKMQAECPNKIVPPIRNFTIQNIPEHNPDQLLGCLFSLFSVNYRKKLLYALARKMKSQDGEDFTRDIIADLYNECEPK